MQHTFIMPALVGFLIMVNLSMFASLHRDRSRRRLAELERVKELLPSHYAALERVHAAHDISLDMKEVALLVSSAIEDEAAAEFFAASLLSIHGRGPYLFERGEIDLLRAKHPELMEVYEEAVGAGILACLLKWPRTARQAARVVDRLLVARHEETAMVIRAAKERQRPSTTPAFQGAF